MKRILCFILSLVMTLSLLTNVYGAEGQQDEIQITDTVYITPESSSGISILGDAAPVVEYQGRKAWQFSGGNTMYFDIDDSFAYNVDDGSTFDFEFEYFSENDSFFEWRYDSWQDSTYFGKVILTGENNVWETQTYTVQNAKFDNVLECKNDESRSAVNGDFWISGKTAAAWFTSYLDAAAISTINVCGVKITKHSKRNPVTNFTEFDEAGNTFAYFDENKKALNELKNTLEKEVTFTLHATGVDQYGNRELDFEDKVTLGPKEEKIYEVPINTERCGIYEYNLELKSDDGLINSHFGPWTFAVVKTDPNGIRDEIEYMHIPAGVAGDPESEYAKAELVAKANAGGVRLDVPMEYVYNAETKEFKGSWSYEHAFKAIRDNNLDVMAILTFAEPNTPTISSTGEAMFTEKHSEADVIPISEKYINYLLEQLGDNIKVFEFWNEPKAKRYNGIDIYLTDPIRFANSYMDLAKITVPLVKRLAPGRKYISGDLGQITREEDYPMFDTLFAQGLADIFDATSIHSYAGNFGYEQSFLEGNVAVTQTEMRRLSQKYSGIDIKIAQTESGSSRSTKLTAEKSDQGNEVIQGYLLGRYIGYNSWTTYMLCDVGNNPETAESYFGLSNSYLSRTVSLDGDTIVPYDGFVQKTALGYWTAKSEFKEMQKVHGDEYIFEFDSDKFNSKVVSFFKSSGESEITLDLGADSLTYSDGYGNDTKVSSDNGIYTFDISERPVYICGKFKQVKVLDTPKFEYSYKALNVAKGDIVEFNIKGTGDTAGMTVELEENGAVSLYEKKDFANGKATIKVKVDDGYTGAAYAKITLSKDGAVNQVSNFRLEVSDPVTCVVEPSLLGIDDYNKWVLNFTVNNISCMKPLKGKIRIKGPEILSSMDEIDIGIIPANKSALIKANTPDIIQKGMYNLEYDIILENGEVYSFLNQFDFTIAVKSRGNIVIDGKIGEDEWNMTTVMNADTKDRTVWLDDWAGPNELSGKTMLQWDEEYLYLMSIVSDDMHVNKQKRGTDIWDGDSLQIGMFYVEDFFSTVEGERVTRFNELTMALLEDGGTYVWKHQDQDQKVEEVADFTDKCEAKAVRDEKEKKTYYEMKVSWKNLMARDEVEVKEGMKFGFSEVYNEDDGKGRLGWIEYASGIGRVKDSTLFTYLTLVE